MSRSVAHKAALLAAALCCAVIATIANADDSDRLIDFGGTKVVVLAGTKSKDGRYAVGWTLRPLNKKVAPIDWSLWSADDWNVLPDHYHMDEESGQANYTVDYFVVDLRSKKTLPIPADYQEMHPSPYWGGISAAWSDEVGGKRYGLFEFDYLGAASEVFPASLYTNKMETIELGLDDVVQAQLPKHTPLDQYTTRYLVTEDFSDRKLPVFHGAYADIIFYIGIRHSADTPSASGILTLRLSDGEVVHVTHTDGEDEEAEAIRDNPELGKADAELNNVYNALERKLASPAREALKKEQRAWVMERDKAVDKAAQGVTDGATDTLVRDKALLELTRKRAAELRARLETIGH